MEGDRLSFDDMACTSAEVERSRGEADERREEDGNSGKAEEKEEREEEDENRRGEKEKEKQERELKDEKGEEEWLEMERQARGALEEASWLEKEKQGEERRLEAANGQIEQLQKDKSSLQGVVELLEKELAREQREREVERQQRVEERIAQEIAQLELQKTAAEESDIAGARKGSAEEGALGSGVVDRYASSHSGSGGAGRELDNGPAGETRGGDVAGDADGRAWMGGGSDDMRRDMVLLRREVQQVRGEILEKERRLQR